MTALHDDQRDRCSPRSSGERGCAAAKAGFHDELEARLQSRGGRGHDRPGPPTAGQASPPARRRVLAVAAAIFAFAVLPALAAATPPPPATSSRP